MSGVKKIRQICVSLCFCAIMLGAVGCGKVVTVVQPQQFKVMADRMSEELIARDLLDDSRCYVGPMLGDGAADMDYGTALYQRLVPDFLFADVAAKSADASFATVQDFTGAVSLQKTGFNIRGKKNIDVNMIAIADWFDTGGKDWLVSCVITPLPGGKTRDYYIAIPEPKADGPLRAKVVAVYEYFGLAGKLYLHDSKSAAQKAQQRAQEAPDASVVLVEETIPGLRSVTEPPAQKTPATELKERNL